MSSQLDITLFNKTSSPRCVTQNQLKTYKTMARSSSRDILNKQTTAPRYTNMKTAMAQNAFYSSKRPF